VAETASYTVGSAETFVGSKAVWAWSSLLTLSNSGL